ncbi:MAG: FG-GAP repeat protein [Gammaproteobacteria bacterium]|nr:FG-GAP repeat protein [Gammaproteobacteria bacterium]
MNRPNHSIRTTTRIAAQASRAFATVQAVAIMTAVVLTVIVLPASATPATLPAPADKSALAQQTLNYEIGFQNIRFSWESILGSFHTKLQISRDGGPNYITVQGAEQLTGNEFVAHFRYWDIDWSKTKFRLQVCAPSGVQCTTRATAMIKPTDAHRAVRRIRSDGFAYTRNALKSGGAWAMIRELLMPPHPDADRWFMNAFKDKQSMSDSFGVKGRVKMMAISADSSAVVLSQLWSGDLLLHTYVRKSDNWIKKTVISPHQPDIEGIGFSTGFSAAGPYQVALSDDGSTLAIGDSSWKDNPPTYHISGTRNVIESVGAVQIYTRLRGQWKRQAILRASNPGHRDNFGISIALSADGNTLAVGANGEDDSTNSASAEPGKDNNDAYNAGAVYIFNRSDGKWHQHSRVKAREPKAFDFMGDFVALSADGKTLAAAVDYDRGSYMDYTIRRFLPVGESFPIDPRESGAIYIFTFSDNTWKQQDILYRQNESTGGHIITSMSLSADGNVLAVGAPFTHTPWPAEGDGKEKEVSIIERTGSASIFARSGGLWSQRAHMRPSIPIKDGHFGYYVSASPDGGTVIIAVSTEHPDTDNLAIDLIKPDDRKFRNRTVYIY